MSDVPQDAAPSSTEPQPTGEVETRPLETKTYADGSQATGYGLPDVSPMDNVTPVISTRTGGAGDVPNDVSVAAAPTAAPDSASNAAGENTTLPSDASSAEPPTLEQRVADLERALVSLPHSIATVMHRGSMGADDFAKAVIAHLFGKE